jgi:hypothetical protein
MIGRKCDECGGTKKIVYEKYKVQSSTVIKVKRNELTGLPMSADIQYWCADCLKKEDK